MVNNFRYIVMNCYRILSHRAEGQQVESQHVEGQQFDFQHAEGRQFDSQHAEGRQVDSGEKKMTGDGRRRFVSAGSLGLAIVKFGQAVILLWSSVYYCQREAAAGERKIGPETAAGEKK